MVIHERTLLARVEEMYGNDVNSYRVECSCGWTFNAAKDRATAESLWRAHGTTDLSSIGSWKG